MAHAVASHSSMVSPTDAGTPLFWKGTALTRRSRSSASRRRTERMQNPQVPSKTRVSCGGRSVKVIYQTVPLPFHRVGDRDLAAVQSLARHFGLARDAFLCAAGLGCGREGTFLDLPRRELRRTQS